MNREMFCCFYRFTPDRPAATKNRDDREVLLHRGQRGFTPMQVVNLGPDFGEFSGKGKAGHGHGDPPLFRLLSIVLIPENFAKSSL